MSNVAAGRRILMAAMVAGVLAGCGGGPEPTVELSDTAPAATAKRFTAAVVAEWSEACDLPTERSNLYGIELDPGGKSVTLSAYAAPAFVDERGQDLAFFLDDIDCILLMMEAPLRLTPESMWDSAPGRDSWGDYDVEWQTDASRLIVTVTGKS